MDIRRSQAILRIPVDHVPANLVLHDGTRFEAVLFVPAGDTITRLLCEGDAFLPVIRGKQVCLVARAAIACLTVPEPPADAGALDLPIERQHAVVHLRSGVTIEGELRWVAPMGRKRTADHLNDSSAPYVAVHADGVVHHVVKAHVALVEEK